MTRILVLEPDPLTRLLLGETLVGAGFDVEVSGDEQVAFAVAVQGMGRFDLVIVDPHAPSVAPDYGFIRRMRSSKDATPVLILSAVSLHADIARGLWAGADDYLAKPFHRDELVARVRAVIRRAAQSADRILQVGDLAVDLERKQIAVADRPIHLTPKEYALLELLAQRVGAVVTREMIMDRLYGGIDEAQTKIVDVFMCKLRRKIRASSACIEGVWGRGYMLRDSARQTPAEQALNRSLSALHHDGWTQRRDRAGVPAPVT